MKNFSLKKISYSFSGFTALISAWIMAPFRFRTLFKGFVNQEIQGRYSGSMGGLVWYLLTPLSNLLMYVFIFSVVFQIRMKPIETGTDSFVLYLLVGLLPWMAFSEAALNSPGLIIGKSNLITKVLFPTEVLPIASVVVTYIVNSVGFFLFFLFLFFKGYGHMMWLWFPVVIGLQMVFTLGFVIWISSLSVFIRDLQQFMGIVMQIWFYLTPILFPLSMVPEKYRVILTINPLYPFVELYHMILLQHRISYFLLGYAAAIAIFLLLSGIIFFNHVKSAFADVL
ncbi:MAG: ABC transporter permease [Deltaproteobacteria bacterium]|nr:ABC transporter permease [Deltaproteobacteria bacterium]